jgi:hypothetical protein
MSYLLSKSFTGWTRDDGIFGFSQDVKLTGFLPLNARLISFHGGSSKPWDIAVQRRSPWIVDHWR